MKSFLLGILLTIVVVQVVLPKLDQVLYWYFEDTATASGYYSPTNATLARFYAVVRGIDY